jgi:riboflavin synthase
MFTGIIEETGIIQRVERGGKSSRMYIKAGTVLEGTRVGDSISTSGVCLTVTEMSENSFAADVMAETMRRSKLGSLTSGSRVNLERAMGAEGRFGGHLVSGHIDGTGTIHSMTREENAIWLSISAEEALLRYIVEKGSIAVDGVSLTVAKVDHSGFQVSIIPHTGKETTLLQQKTGDLVNLECDIIGKYVEKLMIPLSNSNDRKAQLTETFLKQNGFY